MRVLMISGDQNLARPGTSAHARFLMQQGAVEALELIVWPRQFWAPFFVSGEFDVVTSQDPFWRGLVAWVAAKRLRVKLNIQVHADLDAQSPLKHILSQIVLRHAGSVRAVSLKIKEQVARYTNAPVSVLPIFIDTTKFVGLKKIPHERFKYTIVWIGRFEEEKDPMLALRTLSRVRENGLDAGLVMLGEGSLLPALKAQAKADGLEKYIEFPGWQDPVLFLKCADVVLCTSRAESFGASIVEALLAGVPVVSPDVGVAREAGATIASRQELAQKTAHALQEKTSGHLGFSLLNKEAWAKAWKETLQ
jgi:glycosyltransferase involved in cell wall biosynthesis